MKFSNTMRSSSTHPVRQNLGFSLIEIAVVLAVSAVIGLAIWKLLPALRGAASENTPRAQLLDAQQALEGFVLLQHRLPCPDANGDGLEDCGGTAAAGSLPFRTLALSQGATIRYGAFRNANAALPTIDADLVVARLRFSPPVPPVPAPSPGVIGGLDFCVALKNAIAVSPAGVVAAGAIPVAFALVHPGENGQIETANTTTSFAIGSAPKQAGYDDQVLTAGLSEMFGRINCPERLGTANGAARAAYAAYDIDRMAAFHERFRKFDIRVQEQNLAVTELNLLIAAADTAAVTADTAIALAAAVDTELTSLLLSVPALLFAVAETIYGLVESTQAVIDAKASLAESRDNFAAAQTFTLRTNLLYVNARAHAQVLRVKGLVI